MRAPTVRILVVDDEPSILQSTAMLLQELGFEASTLSDATRILDTLRAGRPDVLLQDVRMPGLDLGALFAAVRADPAIARTRILLFSASMDLDEVADGLGAHDKLEKPFRPAELARAIQLAIG